MERVSNGFALIEVLCAVLILTSLAGVLLFGVDTRNVKIETFVRSLCSDIRYVRLRNMSAENTTLVKQEVLEDGRDAYVLKEGGKVLRQVALPKDTVIEHSFGVIQFTCTGVLTGSSRGRGETIKIIDNKSEESTTLTIVPFSGRVLIKEGIYGE